MNKAILQNYLKTEPSNAKEKYIFLIDDKNAALAIISAGFKAVALIKEEGFVDVEGFVFYLKEISFSGVCMSEYIFVTACKTKKANDRLKEYFKAEHLQFKEDGWKPFQQKEYLFKLEPASEQELKMILDNFVSRFEGNNLTQSYHNKNSKPTILSMTQVQEKEVKWVVPQYIVKNSINLLGGDGGAGKTFVWCGIAAAISSGKKVFFDSTPDEFVTCEPQKVLFFSSEDSPEYVLKERLKKAGANLNNIFFVSLQDESFGDIKFNSSVLEDLIIQVKPSLVIFDPIQSFIPPEIQMSKRNAMRNCLNPLIGWGEKYGCTFIIVIHTNKKQGVSGRMRVADSADIWDISRSFLIVGRTQDGKRYLSHEKSNYAEEGLTTIFTIDDSVAKFEEYSDKKDRDFVRETDLSSYQAPQRQDAESFICDFLKNGKKPTAELDEAAAAAGISKSTLNRAKTELRKRGLLGGKSEGYGQNKTFYSYLIDKIS